MLGLCLFVILTTCGRSVGQGTEYAYQYYQESDSDDPSYPFGSPRCSSLESCDSRDAWSRDSRLVHPQAPCQLQVDCIELSTMEGSVPDHANVLSIRSSYFTSLGFKDMKNFTKLTTLQIEYNDLKTIEKGTFASQTQLEVKNVYCNTRLRI